ncbi:solute carrier family 35 member B1 [Galendromus occidentalis]|uniref:Solute carrier family 35 member B1 n=1 Tax=Galendromus occidentalis TaxID=34638 RepID=A0AAJ6QVU6_9ACAR|nr:solute carrier family 35 member B1 [Galendromus occidentalis]
MRRADDLEVVIDRTGELSEKRAVSKLVRGDSTVVRHQTEKMKFSVKLIIYAAGIFISYAVFGIFQEKILRGRYGADRERFEYPFTLLFLQCFVNAALARILLSTIWKQGRDLTTYGYYISASFFYMLAMLTSTAALKYVNYPTQVVAKSCKPIPVMLLGVLLARKRYSLLKYCFVTLIVVGVAIFSYKNDKGAAGESSLFGNTFLCISLISDGLIAALQDRMRQNFQSKSLHMMSQLNFFSVVYVSVAIVFTGEFPLFLNFVQKYPQVLGELALFAGCSAVGQIFIYSMVAEFGPLNCSIVTTCRKLFTVLCSILLFGNALNTQQWIGTVLVFVGLFLDAFFGKSGQAVKKA